jgi:excisionase family DNA binding protein
MPDEAASQPIKPNRNGNGSKPPRFDPLELLTVADVAKLLQVSEWYVREQTTTGRLHCVRLGKAIRYERRALADFIKSHRATEAVT